MNSSTSVLSFLWVNKPEGFALKRLQGRMNKLMTIRGRETGQSRRRSPLPHADLRAPPFTSSGPTAPHVCCPSWSRRLPDTEADSVLPPWEEGRTRGGHPSFPPSAQSSPSLNRPSAGQEPEEMRGVGASEEVPCRGGGRWPWS